MAKNTAKKRGGVIIANKSKNLYSIIITVFVIAALLISGPVNAINIGFTDKSDATPNEETDVSFRMYLDVQVAERIPVMNLTLQIGSDTCTFLPDGTEVSGTLCASIVITKNGNVPYGYGSGAMYGYGLNTSGYYENVSFGSGYGYGYSSNVTYEFDYNVTWTTPVVDSDTAYDVRLDANTKAGSTTHTYSKSETSYFTVQNVVASSGGGGGGGGVPTPAGTETVSLVSVDAGETGTFSFDNDLGLNEIEIKTTSDIKNPQIKVRETLKPVGAKIAISTSSGKVFKYISIYPVNFGRDDVDKIKINFEIPQSWFDENGLSPKTVVLKHFVDGEWEDMPTTLTKQTLGGYEYSATSSWFSTFAVTAKKGATTITGAATTEPETTTTPTPEVEVTPTPEPIDTTVPKKGTVTKSKIGITTFLIFLLVIIIGAIVFMLTNVKSKKKGHPLDNYIHHVKKKGHKRHEVEKKLKDEGWDELTVEHHLNKHYKELK